MSYISELRKKIGTDLLQVPSVAGLIRDSQNRLLFVRKAEDQLWGLPAGAIEIGETPAQAVQREVQEETGLRVIPQKIAGVFGGEQFRHTYPSGDKVEYLVVLIECEVLEEGLATDNRHHLKPLITQLIQKKSNEISEIKFFAEDEMPKIALPYPQNVLFGYSRTCAF